MTQIITSGIIKNTDNKILIVKRASNDSFPDMWEFPGGKSDFGEHPVESAKREILEETGLEVQPFHPVHTNAYHSPSKKNIFYVEIFYECNLIPEVQEIKLSQEHSAFAWVTIDDIASYQTTQYIQQVVNSYKTHLAS